jgi:ABC-type dipeptide/oligopeptide/nickel transport system permease subunit
MNNDAPGMRMVYEGSLQVGIYAFIFFGLLALAVTLWVLYKQDTLRTKYLLLVAWGILPPVWFVVEYFFIFLPYGAPGSFGFFQYGQDIASKLWAGIFALISIDLYKASEKAKEARKRETSEDYG